MERSKKGLSSDTIVITLDSGQTELKCRSWARRCSACGRHHGAVGLGLRCSASDWWGEGSEAASSLLSSVFSCRDGVQCACAKMSSGCFSSMLSTKSYVLQFFPLSLRHMNAGEMSGLSHRSTHPSRPPINPTGPVSIMAFPEAVCGVKRQCRRNLVRARTSQISSTS